ncbi:unnamed protein product, partial [Urochloa humidicola]
TANPLRLAVAGALARRRRPPLRAVPAPPNAAAPATCRTDLGAMPRRPRLPPSLAIRARRAGLALPRAATPA